MIKGIVGICLLASLGCELRSQPGPYVYVKKNEPVYIVEEVETVYVEEEVVYVCETQPPPYYAVADSCTDYGYNVGICCTWTVDYVDYSGYVLETCQEEFCWWEDVCHWEPNWHMCYY